MKLWRWVVFGEVLLALGISVKAEPRNCDREIRNAIINRYRLDSTWYVIDILSSQLRATTLDSGDSLLCRPISQKEPIGLFTILATVTRGGREVEKGQVSVRINKFAEVLVATANLRLHDIVSPDNFALKRMDITSLLEQPVQSLSAIADYRLKRNVGQDQVLTRGAVEPVPDIDVGGEVSIVCGGDQFSIATIGQAMQKGYVGEQIRVKNRASNKVVLATVVDRRTVSIQP
jgi:flagella basal body P-ring formation protein FlgA